MDKEAADLIRKAVADVLNEVRQVPQPQNAHQTITLHHADPPKPHPWPTVVSACACVLMAFLSFVLGFAYLEIREDQRDTAAHLATIYVLVPELRERVHEILKEKP